MDRPLSAHFTLREFTRTSTGLPNTPADEHVIALQALCDHVLEPWRSHVGPLRVTSGYRSEAVNAELRRRGYSASRTSQHLLGEAADVVPVRQTLPTAWHVLVRLVLAADLPVDQAIVYVRPEGRGWIHVSHSARRCRRELLVQDETGRYHTWESWRESCRPLVLLPDPRLVEGARREG